MKVFLIKPAQWSCTIGTFLSCIGKKRVRRRGKRPGLGFALARVVLRAIVSPAPLRTGERKPFEAKGSEFGSRVIELTIEEWETLFRGGVRQRDYV
jgi:hypothetical protein